jgi:hypothetical protein
MTKKLEQTEQEAPQTPVKDEFSITKEEAAEWLKAGSLLRGVLQSKKTELTDFDRALVSQMDDLLQAAVSAYRGFLILNKRLEELEDKKKRYFR